MSPDVITSSSFAFANTRLKERHCIPLFNTASHQTFRSSMALLIN